MMDGWSRRVFAAPLPGGGEAVHDVWERGEGPVVVVIQELPGIGPETLRLADMLIADGFAVALPHLFGPLGRTSMLGNAVRVLCMRREFRLFARGETSPVVGWLRALCRDLRARRGGPGVATIGMCLTGSFAISLMADDAVLAGVASQPSLPVTSQSALPMAPADVVEVRAALDAKGPMRAFRFADDRICGAARFRALDAAFNDDARRIVAETLPGGGHSVLTLDFVDAAGHPTRRAYEDVRDYFRAALAAA